MDNALQAGEPIKAAFSVVLCKSMFVLVLAGLSLSCVAQESRIDRLFQVPGSMYPEVMLRWTLPGGCYYYKTIREDFIADLYRYKQTYEWSGECNEGEPAQGAGELLGLSVNFRGEYIPDETPYTGNMVNGRWEGIVRRGNSSYIYRNGCMSEYPCRNLFNQLDASLSTQPAGAGQVSNRQSTGMEAEVDAIRQEQAASSRTDTSKTSSIGGLADALAAYQKARQGGANKNDARIAALGGTQASGSAGGSSSSSVCGRVLPDWASQCMNRCNEWVNYNRTNSHMRDAPANERELYLKKNLIGVMIGHRLSYAENYKYQRNQYQSIEKANETFLRNMRSSAVNAENTLSRSGVGGETRVDNAFVYSCMITATADEFEKNPVPTLRMSPTVERVMQCPGYNADKIFSGLVIPTHAGVDRGEFDACVRRSGG